jgi:hypothetical protein
VSRIVGTKPVKISRRYERAATSWWILN